ncbi:PGPGW domain-containing protein [Brevundimonas sp.]|uniref:PGPGW domain-containing protein n=1 Tax=Brevundimonas sp. TaxID=1871086 RepID=UPI002FC58864
MSLVLTSLPQPSRRPASKNRMRRLAMMTLGVFIILIGIIISPLPGPGGIPVITLGLILVLRHSYWAKRQFIKAQRAKPKWVYPFRRLMRKNPEIAPVFWQQALRVEKLVVRSKRHRALPRMRRRIRCMYRRAMRNRTRGLRSSRKRHF